jgi:hypothetical protein
MLPAEQVSIQRLSRKADLSTPLPEEVCISTCVVSVWPEERFELHPVSTFRTQADRGVRPGGQRHVYSSRSIAGLRLLQPPERIRVVLHDGVLQSIRTRAALLKVQRKTGPWMLSGRWWSRDVKRLYYDVETSDALGYLIFFDRLTTRWFLQGIFD